MDEQEQLYIHHTGVAATMLMVSQAGLAIFMGVIVGLSYLTILGQKMFLESSAISVIMAIVLAIPSVIGIIISKKLLKIRNQTKLFSTIITVIIHLIVIISVAILTILVPPGT